MTKKAFLFTIGLCPIVNLLAQAVSSPELDDIASDLSGVQGPALIFCKALCAIGACIGLIKIASNIGDGDQGSSIFRWALLVVVSVAGYTALQTLFTT